MLGIAQQENCPVTRIDSIHALLDKFNELARLGDAHRPGRIGGDEVGESRLVFIAEGGVEGKRSVPAATEEIPIAVAREIEGDAVQPRRQRGIAPKTAQRPMRPDECVLRNLVGVGPVVQHSERDGKKPLAVARNDFVERRRVAGVETQNEPRVMERVPLGRFEVFFDPVVGGAGEGGMGARGAK